MMIVDNVHEMGDEVFLKTDPDQMLHIVTGITVRPAGLIEYKLSCVGSETTHFECEICVTQNILVKR